MDKVTPLHSGTFVLLIDSPEGLPQAIPSLKDYQHDYRIFVKHDCKRRHCSCI